MYSLLLLLLLFYFYKMDSLIESPGQEIEVFKTPQQCFHVLQSQLILFPEGNQAPDFYSSHLLVGVFLIVYHPSLIVCILRILQLSLERSLLYLF